MTMTALLTLLAGGLLAFANGANDNFKGVATLYGSRTTTFGRALAWGTITTLLGSLLSAWLARDLWLQFSGNGPVSDEVVALPGFGAAVALGAAATVLLATRIGFPVSSTHAIIGTMIGVAVSQQSEIAWMKLIQQLLLPLLFSPFVAFFATVLLYPCFRRMRLGLGISQATCLCAGRDVLEVAPGGEAGLVTLRLESWSASLDMAVTCRERYVGRAIGLDAGNVLDGLHYLSAGLVGFARGLNDTPKIAALLLTASVVGQLPGLVLVGVAIALGGVIGSRRVAESLSHRITEMNAGQGFTGNLVTALLVTLATRWGWPVSTTHVSCGALFGIGAVNRHAHWSFIRTIIAAWCITAPVGGLFGYLAGQCV